MQRTQGSLRCLLSFSFLFACGQSDGNARLSARGDVGMVAQAATVLPNFIDEVWVSGLDSPTAFTFAPNGAILVAEQDGRVRAIRDGILLQEPFAVLPASSEGERGLLGIAVDPNFESNGHVYVFYTAAGPPFRNRVSRLTASGDVALAGSETVLFELEDVRSCLIHMGGAVHFAPDGHLIVAVGDLCEPTHVQRLDRFAGKLLRLRADGTIPADNPFYDRASGPYRAIFALGFRNPYTFAISASGRMLINDVGLDRWEEINEGVAGANYGWPESEGATTTPGHTSPLFAYPHSGAGLSGCAVTGGVFYEPPTPNFPSSFEGKYLFADYCRSYVRTLDPSTRESQPFLEGARGVVDLRVGPDGMLYRLERETRAIARVRYAAQGQAPAIALGPESRTVAAGQQVTFAVRASGSEPLQYQWQRDGVDIAGATAASYSTTASRADDGAQFGVVVRNPLGSVTSERATLRVTPNAAPVVTIDSPVSGARYAGGDTIVLRGRANDEDDGSLPASAFTWEVVFHHDTHTHPFIAPFTGVMESSFVVPRIGHTETNVFYRIHLTARDSSGLQSTTFRDVAPDLADLTLTTIPSGLTVTLDGIPLVTPMTVPSVVGITRTLGAPSPQSANGTTYIHTGWSGGGTVQQSVDTPASDTTFTATFQAACVAQLIRPVAARASSTETAQLGAEQAIDGNLSTRWSSAFADNQWLELDLGASRLLLRAVLHWEIAHAREYELRLGDSPDGPFRTIARRDRFGGSVDELTGLAARGRYLRIHALRRATMWGNSLWEVELFGAAEACSVPPRRSGAGG